MDEVVWPNYVREHAWMFQDGDVDGGEVLDAGQRERLLVGPGKGERGMGELLRWSVQTIEHEVGKKK